MNEVEAMGEGAKIQRTGGAIALCRAGELP
jgi:hypothetical protein